MDNRLSSVTVRKMLGEKRYISNGAYYPRKEVRGMDISRSAFAGAAAFMMIFGAMLVLVPQTGQAAANPVPILSLALDQPSATAKVTESAPGIVTFTGHAGLDKLPVERCVVTLTATVDAGWASSITPTQMVFTTTTPQSLSVTVIVPQGTSNQVYGKLTVNGRAVATGLQSTTHTEALISVDPYFRIQLSADTPFREITPGAQAFYTLTLTNQGNAIDSYEFEISNLKDLANKKWTVVLSATTISRVNPNEPRPLRLTCQSPKDWTIWKNEPTVIIIKATSQNAKDFQEVISLSFNFYAYERGYYIPGFDPLFIVAAFAIGLVFLRRKRL